MELVEQRTLEWEVRWQHADVVKRNLSSIAVIKVDVECPLIITINIIIIVVIIVTRRFTDLARMKAGELLTPVSTDASTDRQLRPRRRTNNQRLANTNKHVHAYTNFTLID